MSRAPTTTPDGGALPPPTLRRRGAAALFSRFRTRLFLYICALSLATAATSAAIYYTRQLGFIQKDRARRARTLLTSLATQAELCAYAGDAALCYVAAHGVFNEDDVLLVAVYDRRGLAPDAATGKKVWESGAKVELRMAAH